MKPKKQLIVTYQGEEVNLWDFYDEQGNLLVQHGHIWDDDLDLSERNLSDKEDLIFIENVMPDLSFLHVTGDVDISSNQGLTDLSKLPHKIDGNLFANHCSGYKNLDGLPQIGKNLYLIGSSMEYRAHFIACRATMGGGDPAILNQYPLEDEIVRENLPVKGQIFTPMGYARWKENNQRIIHSLSEKAYALEGKHKALAKHLLDWYPPYVLAHDPQMVHGNKRLSKDNEGYNERQAAKEQAQKAAKEESLRRAEEVARKEAEGEINKALSANHTQNTVGAKDWAQRQLAAGETPRRSIRKKKKKQDTPAVTEGKELVDKLKAIQKGTLVIQMPTKEVEDYIQGISDLKCRIDNYVKEDEESFPVLLKLMALRKEYLFKAISGKNAYDLEMKVIKKAMDVVGYHGNGKRKEAKKCREKQQAIAARTYESKRAKCVAARPAQPTQQMPKKDAQFKIPRKLKKEVIETIRKLYSLALAVDRSSARVVMGVSVNLLAALQNNNQRK